MQLAARHPEVLVTLPPDYPAGMQGRAAGSGVGLMGSAALGQANPFAGPVASRKPERLGSGLRHRQLSAHPSGDAYTLEDVQNSLYNTGAAPGASCHPPDLNEPDYERYATIVATVRALFERVLYRLDGPPATALYQRVTLQPVLQPVSGKPA